MIQIISFNVISNSIVTDQRLDHTHSALVNLISSADNAEKSPVTMDLKSEIHWIKNSNVKCTVIELPIQMA